MSSILFFIGKEVINVARSADIVLFEKSVKRISYFFPQRNFICADVIRHQNNNIITGCFNIVTDISVGIMTLGNHPSKRHKKERTSILVLS